MSSNPEHRPSPLLFLDVGQDAPAMHDLAYEAGDRAMAIDMEAEAEAEYRLSELELLRDQRSLLLEQMNEITRFLAELEQRIAELEQRPQGVFQTGGQT